jgi:hypothetical protein
MVVGATIAFLFILGLFLSMLGSSPKTAAESECSSDTDTVQELLQTPDSVDTLIPAA